MVELVEVEDESFETKQAGPSDDEEYTDTGTPILNLSSAPSHQLTSPRL
jgi:import receptor subunit TOM22